MDRIVNKGLLAVSTIAALLALGACGESRNVASTDPRSESSTQVTGQAGEISRQEKQDTTVMGGPPATPSSQDIAAASPMGERIDDAQIVSGIKAQFAGDKDISAMAIDVDSKEGMVTLSGTVPNSDAKVRADQIAKAMKDVKSVNNQLEVKAG